LANFPGGVHEPLRHASPAIVTRKKYHEEVSQQQAACMLISQTSKMKEGQGKSDKERAERF